MVIKVVKVIMVLLMVSTLVMVIGEQSATAQPRGILLCLTKSGTLYRLDPHTGEAAFWGETGFHYCSGLDADPRSGFEGWLYAMCEAYNEDVGEDRGALISISSSNGAFVSATVEQLAENSLNGATDISFDSDGALVAYFLGEAYFVSLPNDFAFDLANTNWTLFLVGEGCCGLGHGIAFSRNGDLYHANPNNGTGKLEILQKDTTTSTMTFYAHPTVLASLESNQINAMDFDTTNNILYALVRKDDTDFLATINTTTGAVTIKGPIITDSGQSLSDVEGIAWLVQPRDNDNICIVNDKVDFVVKGWKFDSTVKRTPISSTHTSGEISLLGAGGVLDQLYGLKNLIRIDNDQIWANLDGGATVKAKFTARDEQTLCYIDANDVFHTIFTETGNGFCVSSSGTIPGKEILPAFRWGLRSSCHTWSSQPIDNSDCGDHMVTWLIKGGPSAGNFVIAWEDFDCLGDKDYQDLVVEIDNVSTLTDQIGTFTITAELTNTSVENINIYEPVKAVVNTLEYTDDVSKQFRSILLSATEGAGTKGSKQTIDVGEGVLIPDESVTVDFVIGLSVRSRFSFFVDVEGR
jgi:hypothetical protein